MNDKTARNPSVDVNPGDLVTYQRQVILRGETSPFRLIFEDPYILVIDKPAGILTYGEKGSGGSSAYKELKDYLSKTAKARVDLFVVHRLDREVSGLLMYLPNPRNTGKAERRMAGIHKKIFCFCRRNS